jgi:hypothetical protein
VKCRRCKKKLQPKARGPLPVYCRSCRQRHYEEGSKGLMQMVLAQKINSLKLQPMIRAEVHRYLDRFVIDATTKPKLWHSEPVDRAPLRVVRNENRDDDPTAA